MVKGDMIITSPVSENYLIFTTSEKLDAYRLSGLAKAGQLVKLVDLSTNKYKLYILETDMSATGGLKYTEILRRDTYDNTKVKYMILGENDDLPQAGDEKTDYYKLEDNNYIHYRWINNDYEIVGGNSYSKVESDNRYTKTSSGSIPTTSTAGNPGDIIKADDALYECFGMSGTYYIWKKVSFGGGAAFTSEAALRDAIIAGDITAGMSISLLENGKYKNYIIQTVNTTTGAYTKTQSGGTTDYAQLSNKPTINNVELSGNKTLAALGINAGSVGFDETGTYADGSIGAVVYNQKKAINNLYDGIHTEIVNWEHGKISEKDGQNVNPAQTSRARAIGYISTDYAITVDRTTIAYEVYIFYYDANKDFVFRTSVYRDSAIAPNKNYAYYRIAILNSSAQSATIDVSRLKIDFTFTKELTFDSQDIYTEVGAFTDKSLFKRNTVGGTSAIGFRFESSTTRIATNPIVSATAKSYHIVPSSGYKYGFYTCLDETTLSSAYSQQKVWRTEENTFKISDNINYVILVIAKTDDSAIDTDDFDKVTVTAEETVQYAINDVYAKIAEAKDDDLLPNYWKEYFNTKETALESADIGLGFNGVSLAFITDIHLGTNNKISPLLLKYITTHTNVRYVVCGGDIVTNVSTKDVALSELNWWMQKTSGLDIVNLHGNHDGNSNNQPDNTQIISDAEFYGLCCRQSENVVNWEHNSLFGYRDNQVQKMRFIYLDTGAPDSAVISNAQIEWMQGKISELPTGWFVLVFCHQFWTGASKSTSTLSLDANGTKILNALETIYDTANATICGVIVGHCHRNYSLISAKGFPVIATTCDTSGTGSSRYDPDTPNRTSETTEEQVIDLFYVNTSARTINTIRIGDGDTEQDRSFTF